MDPTPLASRRIRRRNRRREKGKRFRKRGARKETEHDR